MSCWPQSRAMPCWAVRKSCITIYVDRPARPFFAARDTSSSENCRSADSSSDALSIRLLSPYRSVRTPFCEVSGSTTVRNAPSPGQGEFETLHPRLETSLRKHRDAAEAENRGHDRSGHFWGDRKTQNRASWEEVVFRGLATSANSDSTPIARFAVSTDRQPATAILGWCKFDIQCRLHAMTRESVQAAQTNRNQTVYY